MTDMTKNEARALADRIDNDPRNDAYDAHGLNDAGDGWYVCVNDTQGTAKNPDGRALEIHSVDEWDAALASR